ncbi:hypothetical protein ABZP36_003452 [Zizania latifolia]
MSPLSHTLPARQPIPSAAVARDLAWFVLDAAALHFGGPKARTNFPIPFAHAPPPKALAAVVSPTSSTVKSSS